jgi:hypothetical protein
MRRTRRGISATSRHGLHHHASAVRWLSCENRRLQSAIRDSLTRLHDSLTRNHDSLTHNHYSLTRNLDLLSRVHDLLTRLDDPLTAVLDSMPDVAHLEAARRVFERRDGRLVTANQQSVTAGGRSLTGDLDRERRCHSTISRTRRLVAASCRAVCHASRREVVIPTP